MQEPQTIQDIITQGGTMFTFMMGAGSALMSFFDTHAAGIGAMVAILALVVNTAVNIYYRRRGK